MFNISAEDVYQWAHVFLIIGAILAVAGTAAAYFSGKILNQESNERIAKAGERAAEATESAAIANKSTEKLRRQNLLLKQALSPRVLDQYRAAQELRPFAGVKFLVVAPADSEPRLAAQQIHFVLLEAGWIEYPNEINQPFAFHDGISVHTTSGANNKRGHEATNVLVSLLTKNGFEAHQSYPLGIEPNLVVVEVGPKPLPRGLQVFPP